MFLFIYVRTGTNAGAAILSASLEALVADTVARQRVLERRETAFVVVELTSTTSTQLTVCNMKQQLEYYALN